MFLMIKYDNVKNDSYLPRKYEIVLGTNQIAPRISAIIAI